MRISTILSAVLLSLLLVAFLSAVPVHAALSWNVQTVDTRGAGIGNGYCPIVVDSNNTPHIAYTNLVDSTYFVMYASWNGSSWNTQTVSQGMAFSLVFDSNDNPHILFKSGWFEPLKYASWTGAKWVTQTVDKNGAGFGVVALDLSGNPHVAYTDGTTVKYASLVGSNWNIQTVDTYKTGEIPFQLSFSLDRNNTAYIMYGSPSSYVDNNTGIAYSSVIVKLASLKNSSWDIQNVLASSNLGSWGNMVLDSKGYPHLICMLANTLVYASWTGSAWSTKTVISNANLRSMFLALDSQDYPHISYIDQALMYIYWTGSDWSTQTVSSDTNTSVRWPCYLAVDSNGNPHISYLATSPDIGFPNFIVYMMYATANKTTETFTPSPTQTSSPTFSVLSLLLVFTAVIIGAVVTVVYVWKKKLGLSLKPTAIK